MSSVSLELLEAKTARIAELEKDVERLRIHAKIENRNVMELLADIVLLKQEPALQPRRQTMSESEKWRTVRLSPADTIRMTQNLDAAIEWLGMFNRFFSTFETGPLIKRLEETRGNLLVAIKRDRIERAEITPIP